LDPITVGLPASLLDRRPDVTSAEMGLRASNDRVGVSIASLYPDLTLSGSVGRNSDTWGDLWKDETEVYSAVIQLAQPIFRGGQLRAQVRASKARYEELAAVYASVVINAIREVEDALVSEQLLQQRLIHAKERLVQAKAAEDLAVQRYQRGIETILTVLETQRRRIVAEDALALLKGNIWTTRVNIYLALGGDWTASQNISDK
jgi:outer membrane protein TolC